MSEKTEKEIELNKKFNADYLALKNKMFELLFNFIDEYSEPDTWNYPNAAKVMFHVCEELLAEVEYKVALTPKFTPKQIDHICYQIGEWYLMMKPLLEGQHNLGHMKERLKIMICGDDS